MALKPITIEDWNKYEFIDACVGSNSGVFIRGIKKTNPPDDGYEYIEATTMGDSEQKWMRAMEYVKDVVPTCEDQVAHLKTIADALGISMDEIKRNLGR